MTVNNQVTCSRCGVVLTGGRDTFGTLESPVCFTCKWLADAHAERIRKARSEMLRKRIVAMQQNILDLENELSAAHRDLDIAEQRQCDFETSGRWEEEEEEATA